MAGDWERRKARALLAIGRLLTQLGEDTFAIEMLQKVVGLRPELIAAHVELGIVYGKIEDYRKMVEILREAHPPRPPSGQSGRLQVSGRHRPAG